MSGLLSIVPTPIGNLEDMSFRAIAILRQAALVLAEDTRTSKVLLRHFDIDTPLRAYHMHNEHKITEGLADQMAAGAHYALISDAGTPAISDPGYMLVNACLERQVRVECLPGPTAFVPALVCSGLPAHNFVFEGFLPPKKGRQTRLEILANEERSLIFYESPHRLVRSLRDLILHFGPERPATVSREISKRFEEHQRGRLDELLAHFETHMPRGEIVICVGGSRS